MRRPMELRRQHMIDVRPVGQKHLSGGSAAILRHAPSRYPPAGATSSTVQAQRQNTGVASSGAPARSSFRSKLSYFTLTLSTARQRRCSSIDRLCAWSRCRWRPSHAARRAGSGAGNRCGRHGELRLALEDDEHLSIPVVKAGGRSAWEGSRQVKEDEIRKERGGIA